MTISAAQNELLTRVESDAPMGQMLRNTYWTPALASSELIADGPPQRVRLFGENYVAFRATDGRVGFMVEACPHRRVSLALGRNEENGLRCIFHGWKFNVDGKCIEAPTQIVDPERFCSRVPVKSYLAQEAGGVVWVWFGAREKAPPLPNFQFMNAPEAGRKISYQDVPCNWVQGVESNMDSAHVGILHQSAFANITAAGEHLAKTAQSRAPRYEIDETPYGFRYAAVRDLSDGTSYVRINTFIAPYYSIVCANSAELPTLFIIATPVDDRTMRFWLIPFHISLPITQGVGFYFDPDTMRFPPALPGDADSIWGQDRAAMANGHWTGFPQHAFTEDFAVMVSQGAIADRSDEFLNNGDLAVVKVRSILLNAVRAFTNGKAPDGVGADFSAVSAVGAIVESATDWRSLAVA